MTFKIDDPERQRLFKQAHDAGSPEEWDAAWQALLDWKRHHPDDTGVEDAFEMLALLKLSVSQPEPVTTY